MISNRMGWLVAALVAFALGFLLLGCGPKVIIKREIVYIERDTGKKTVQKLPDQVVEQQPPKDVPASVTAAMKNVIAQATAHVGKRRVRVNGRSFRFDCSNFVRGVFTAANVNLFALGPEYPRLGGVRLIFRYIERFGRHHRNKRPTPGDVVYFDNTWDHNRNGQLDDPLTHIALVEKVDPDGTFYIIHRTSRGIVRDPMNLYHPHRRRDENKKIINAWLRRKSRRDPPGAPHLNSELFAGFGTVPLSSPELVGLLMSWLSLK